MMMIETFTLITALSGGLLLGLIFFGGLKWTIQRGLFSKQPFIWFLLSLLLRTVIVLAGFYLAAKTDSHNQNLLTCLLGFIAAQMLITWFNPRSANIKSAIGRG